MILARALLFNVYFFGLTFLLAFPAQLVLHFARPRVFGYARWWAGLVLAGARVICGIRVQVTGLEHLAHGPAVLASQHQSAFDTLVWMNLAPRASYVVKQELTRIPLFGPLLAAAGMVPVDRDAGASALRALLVAADQAKADNRQIVIFPEGTRVAPGERVPLQPGIAAIASRLDLPVTPVATDSGHCWGRRAFTKYPGVIHIAIGAPIEAGGKRAALLAGIEAHWRASEAVWSGGAQ
jgi:1-acyl-sn-glycerol-3-phosphate acyltransferase